MWREISRVGYHSYTKKDKAFTTENTESTELFLGLEIKIRDSRHELTQMDTNYGEKRFKYFEE